MMPTPKLGAPQVAPAQQPTAAPPAGAAPLTISPEITRALQQIAQGIGAGQQPADQMPIDRNSPEYRQAMLQQLASSGPMGALGSVFHQWGDARKQQQAQQQNDMNAWMPVVTKG